MNYNFRTFFHENELFTTIIPFQCTLFVFLQTIFGNSI